MVQGGDPGPRRRRAGAAGRPAAAPSPPDLADGQVASGQGRGGARRSCSRARTVETSSDWSWRAWTRSSSGGWLAPHDAVDGEPGVALELGTGPRGQVAEDPVDPPGVEAQGARGAAGVRPRRRRAAWACGGRGSGRPRREPGLDQGVPGLGAADAVDPQAPAVLEGLDRRPASPGPKLPSGRRGGEARAPRRRWTSATASPRRPLGAGGPRVEGLQVRRELLEQLALGLGADQAGLGSPSLNRIRVGMLITS